MEKQYDFRISRVKNFPVLMISSLFFVIFGLGTLLSVLFTGMPDFEGAVIILPMLMIVGWLFGIASYISLVRLIKAPVLLTLNADGLIYYYSTFHSSKKQIHIPWESIKDITTGSFSYLKSSSQGISYPVGLAYITIEAETGFFKNYNAWRQNIFLSRDCLKIETSSLTNYSNELLDEKINFYLEKWLEKNEV